MQTQGQTHRPSRTAHHGDFARVLAGLVLSLTVGTGLVLAGGAQALADPVDGSPTVVTTVGSVDDAGIQSAGMASRAPGTKCGKKSVHHRVMAKRACSKRSGGR
ncbi:hypothetical protein [Nocardioides sp. LHG3406-4]|uniref:hypothetical protein n=1 Tax=Nocardioides sp. LHG3406-4 TaxID=2804575 RepID=UPI003CEC7535